jgi:hypothetical protein
VAIGFKNIGTRLAQLLLWVAVVMGCFVTAMSVAQIYMLTTGSQPGTPISPDDLAPTKRDALLDLAYGVALIAAPFLLRTVVRRWPR